MKRSLGETKTPPILLGQETSAVEGREEMETEACVASKSTTHRFKTQVQAVSKFIDIYEAEMACIPDTSYESDEVNHVNVRQDYLIAMLNDVVSRPDSHRLVTKSIEFSDMKKHNDVGHYVKWNMNLGFEGNSLNTERWDNVPDLRGLFNRNFCERLAQLVPESLSYLDSRGKRIQRNLCFMQRAIIFWMTSVPRKAYGYHCETGKLFQFTTQTMMHAPALPNNIEVDVCLEADKYPRTHVLSLGTGCGKTIISSMTASILILDDNRWNIMRCTFQSPFTATTSKHGISTRVTRFHDESQELFTRRVVRCAIICVPKTLTSSWNEVVKGCVKCTLAHLKAEHLTVHMWFDFATPCVKLTYNKSLESWQTSTYNLATQSKTMDYFYDNMCGNAYSPNTALVWVVPQVR